MSSSAQMAKIKAMEAQILEKVKATANNESLISLIPDKYDPTVPNDYSEYCKERENKQRREAAARQQKRREEERAERELRDEERRKEYERKREEDAQRRAQQPQADTQRAPPPQEQQRPSVRAPPNPGMRSGGEERAGDVPFAQRYMKEQGWKAGEGLGANGQGLASALEHQKTGLRTANIVQSEAPKAAAPVPEKKAIRVKGRPTRVILLLNMVGPGEVDKDLQGEIEEECTKYGPVERTAIHEVKTPGVDPKEAVRIFAKFVRQESAMKALVDLNGRFFGGRHVAASFFPMDKFDKSELAP